MYDIMMDSQVVGQAEVMQEGLYYRFSCKCTPPDNSIHRILVGDGNNTKDLGICVPTGEWFCLVARVPVKYLPGENLSFTLVSQTPQTAAITVKNDKPFLQLDQLESARLLENDGGFEVLIDPVPDPQDSDQSPESQHKWELP